MRFSITILGSNSATPAHGRHPTSQLLQFGDHYFLIDCGEGTQIRLNALKAKWGKISRIFISHLHGDHYFGLIGLLTTYHLNKRKKPLHIHSYPELKAIIDLQLQTAGTVLSYPIHFHNIIPDSSNVIFADEGIKVRNFPLSHRIPCSGFIFREGKTQRHILPDKIREYEIPYEQIRLIKSGKDYIGIDGSHIPNEQLTLPPSPRRSYAYCTDTIALDSTVSYVKGVDLLYHEATFDADSELRAEMTFHSTTKQAAQIALKAGVQRLLIGHFSSKYRKLNVLLEESREVFANTDLALEGKSFVIERQKTTI